MSQPAIVAVPEVGLSIVASILRVVVFPAPFSPAARILRLLLLQSWYRLLRQYRQTSWTEIAHLSCRQPLPFFDVLIKLVFFIVYPVLLPTLRQISNLPRGNFYVVVASHNHPDRHSHSFHQNGVVCAVKPVLGSFFMSFHMISFKNAWGVWTAQRVLLSSVSLQTRLHPPTLCVLDRHRRRGCSIFLCRFNALFYDFLCYKGLAPSWITTISASLFTWQRPLYTESCLCALLHQKLYLL